MAEPINDARGTESALLIAVVHGDETAARRLVSELGPRLLRHTARMLGDRAEAEDIVQETFVRLWKMAPNWDQRQAKVSTWAFRVAVNLARDRLRRKRRSVPMDAIAEPETPLASVVAQMTETARRSALDTALAALSERQRQAVSLRHIEELSNPEIAEIMDISIEAVESLTARGKRALASVLRGQQDALGYQDEE